MNSNRRVFLFVLYSIGLFLFLSLVATFTGFIWLPFQRVNLVSDLVIPPPDTASAAHGDTATNKPPIIIQERPDEDFTLYRSAHLITNFRADTTKSSLLSLMEKLKDLKDGKKRKVRIAYFGDSMIEGDLLTQTLRRLLQEMFGGNGVGFVPITSQVSKFRTSVVDNYSDTWEEQNFKEGKNKWLYLSGHLFHTANGWVQMRDQTIHDSAVMIEKSLICGKFSGNAVVTINRQPVNIQSSGELNRIVIGNSRDAGIQVSIADERIPVYGISFESESGIFVDNFSFRGITGVEYGIIDSTLLTSIAENNPYDLIVFQYGVNLLFRPNDKNYNWYGQMILPVIKKLRRSFPGTEFLLVSTADRAFRYAGEYKSAVGIDSLVKLQAELAFATKSSFYNQFAAMGGTNSIVAWANAHPSLANQDYVHPNHRGAEILGTYLYEALLKEYDKYLSSLKK
jgi:lysophospholipase L1-like esterase